MENLNQSFKEAVCIDEEVFFGPITDKERKIREQFEILHKNEFSGVEASKTVEDDESQNNSMYKSFSVDESKYDSFDDSLNERNDKMPQDKKVITLRKSYDKIKSKRSGFYDSLEDVCSLVSNIDKCSISCEIENESNLNSKHFVEDSLKILSMPVANKNNFISDSQVHFDDDSLAILECETTFSDSLEEVNVLESIEIEEINDIENITMENQNAVFTVEQHSACTKNLFDTSVEIVCEKNIDSAVEPEESFDDKNLLYDSLSNSDFKDILTDSLEEGKQLKEVLNLSKYATINVNCDNENVIEKHNRELFNTEQNSANSLPNLFDTSLEIISKKQEDNIAISKDFLNDKNLSSDSISEVKNVSKDSLEESNKSNEILNIFQQSNGDNIVKSEDIYQTQNALETSVQIIYDNAVNCFDKESINKKNYNSKGSFKNNFQETSKFEIAREMSSVSENDFSSKNLSEDFNKISIEKNTLLSDSHVSNDEIKTDISVTSDSSIPIPANDVSDVKKGTFSVDSCQLKILSDGINIDKDLKFQLHIEVTVGDKKCQIASQNIRVVPILSEGCILEKNSDAAVSVVNPLNSPISDTTSHIEQNKREIHLNNSLSFKNKDCNIFRAHSPGEINSASHKTPEEAFMSNITQRAKSFVSQSSCAKLNCIDSFNDVSLLQALDLPDLSTSFLNESIIQSKDSLIPLNLYSPGEFVRNFHIPQFKNKNKENIPEHMQNFENENFCSKRKSYSPNKVCNSKTPQTLQKCSSFKETNKKTPGTKIPIRKADNFAVPVSTPNKFAKPTLSAEKVKKCRHSPNSVDGGKKTPGTTPNKIPHICKVRNTIFSKVPQIIPSKKYMNVQSPVAQYIKNNSGPMKTPGTDPVLRDCMNHQMESPLHLYHAHASGSLKSSKKKT